MVDATFPPPPPDGRDAAPSPHCFTRREPLSAYLACDTHISSSALRRFERTGRAPQDTLAPDPTPREASLGDALHALLLEPDRFALEFFGMDGEDPPRGDVALPELLQRTWLSSRDCTALRLMQRNVRACTRAPLAQWLDTGAKELSLYWEDADGMRWKGRPDCFVDGVVVELKTTTDVRPQRFAKSRRRFGYDLQAALYVEGVTRLTGRRPRFVYVMAESVRPHSVWTQELDATEIAVATEALANLKARFRAAWDAHAAARYCAPTSPVLAADAIPPLAP
ncbi:MAG: PD-(D/E)XK nuclease-like domain-containing protein [Burkholderiales bacterium]|jgi:exodeoxyribonuclease VIII|nr:PD-(D/E)XK nuclease-like domain-containing protein [Burkholderiales bacterium]